MLAPDLTAVHVAALDVAALHVAALDLHALVDGASLMGPVGGAGPTVVTGLAVGVAAGLVLSIPFGALSAMLVEVGMRSTPRVAMSAAVGVASTDVVFALVAATTGSVVSAALAPWRMQVQVVAAVVVLLLGAHALHSALREESGKPTGRHVATRSGPPGQQVRSTWLRFVVAAAANPMTTLTLTALAASLGPSTTPAVVVAFAAGCGVASIVWHSCLSLGGHLLGRWLTVRARRAAAWAGAVVTVGMAAQMVMA
ncbi:Arginine exporter protein ArgO [Quadrisphaera granulorum]|uniref:Arginine exporter protein ArgO n=1 Tax=Quadrisphaera granulorum TaxID=317664 RepID=A0A315ZQN7_9ACTN|nr:arginine exporter protein ArgO [Quadrisphaera granulorum]SZE98722.1 Arginine exporter protein ArgO [Quadrisphaera granulorum]